MTATDARQSSLFEKVTGGKLGAGVLWTEASSAPTRAVTLIPQEISKLCAVLWRV